MLPRNGVTGSDLALGDYPEVEAGAMLRDKQIGHLGFAQTHANPEARDARLGDLEFGAVDAVPVPNADLVIRESSDGEVLPEVPRFEIVSMQVRLPKVVRLHLIQP